MVCMTLDCLTSSVIQIFHRSVGLKCFFICLNAVIIVSFFYIYISQGSVEMQFWCGGIYNNHIVANCLQSVQVTHSVREFVCICRGIVG